MKLFSDSPIRRYTPPTCTLEIWAKPSALSFWSDRDLIKDLRFQLNFDDPRRIDEKQITIAGDRIRLQQLSDVVGTYVHRYLQQPSLEIPVAVETLADTKTETANLTPLPGPPVLKPSGLLSHELSFGLLATDPATSAIQLSVSQLFDLAEALEQCNADLDVLPALDRTKKRKNTIIWASTAASAILAVGLATIGTRVYQTSKQPSVTASNQEATSTAQAPQSKIEEVVPPIPSAPAKQPTPSPTMPSSLKNRETLPPPPPVIPPSKTSVAPVTPPKPNLPTSVDLPKGNSKPSIAIVPQASQKPKLPSTQPTRASNPESVAKKPSQTRNLPQLPSLESETPAIAENSIDSSSAVTSKKPEAEKPPENQDNAENRTALVPDATESPSETNNLLDTIPQVTEARQYFQARWQAPEGLNQRLEYRLVVNSEGAIARIVPLGRAAGVYIDRTQMPLMGTPFVSPLQTGNNATIRLVLNPDGSVKTFLEN
jgi:hypothetical protein